jgi:hypothetical protein
MSELGRHKIQVPLVQRRRPSRLMMWLHRESDIMCTAGDAPRSDLKGGVNGGQHDLEATKSLVALPRLDSNQQPFD